MGKIILSALIFIAFFAGNGFAQPLFNPDEFTTYYLDLDLLVPYKQLGLGSEIDLALDSHGTLFITDPSHARVLRFTQGGQGFSVKNMYVELIGKTIGKPRRISISGKDVWVADPDRREILKIKTANSVLWHISDFDSPFDWISDITHAENESLILLDSGTGFLYRVDNRNNIEQIYTFPLFKKHSLIGVAYSNSIVAVADDKANIWLINVSGQDKKLIHYKHDADLADITSFRTGFLIADRSGHLWALDTSGERAKQYILASSFLHEPSRITAMGMKVVVADSAGKNILFYTLKPSVTAYQHMFMGEELLGIGFPAEALNEFVSAKTLDPKLKNIWALEGRAYYELKMFKKAIATFKEAVMKLSNDVENIFWLANSYYKLGDHSKAAENYRLLLEKDPNHVPALANLGSLYAILGKPRKAEEAFKKAVKLDPSSVEASLGYGKWLLSRKRFQRAILFLNAFIKVRPDILETTHYLGLAYAQNGDCENAIPLLETASKTGPFFSESLLALSECYLAVGRTGKAKSALKYILKITPDHAEALRRLTKISD